jgi:S1-C subfamily serine protease
VNAFDLAVVVLVVIAVIIGFRSGALPQLIGLAGAILGGGLALVLLPHLAAPLTSIDSPQLRAFVVLAAILFCVGIGEAIGSAIGRTAAAMLGEGLFGALDRVMGGFVGAAQALLVVWLTGSLLAAGPSATLASQARSSLFVRALGGYLPAPTEMAAELSQILDGTGLPDFFIGLEPIAPPVTLPDDPLVKGLAKAAIRSTVKVQAGTCLSLSSGTGFVVKPGYVVTNAHVIAGAGTVRVAEGGEARDAAPVFFDPKLDIAVLYAPGLTAPPLRFATSDPDRGAVGATFGFPGGMGLDPQPAAVTGAYAAQGRDIYGTGRVTRRILELRAQIEQGDSGGPLILSDGTVGGVVFAEARTDPNVGYALTPTSVREAIAPALSRTGLVPVGSCIH